MKIYTIGHSTRPIGEFIDILNKYEIDLVVDIRSISRSHFNPQFDRYSLEKSLNDNGVYYVHMDSLGGFRNPLPYSVNEGWKNKRFRGFADHMQTKDFKNGLKKLIHLSKKYNVVIMCSESLPWRCHRSLIADALIVHGFDVYDIFNINTIKQHTLTPWAKINGRNITYPLD